MQKIKRISVLFLSVILILGCSFSSYADLRDLMIATDSNALMTLDLTDRDYLMMSSRSSIASIKNTVNLDSVNVFIRLINEESGMYEYQYPSVNASGGFRYYVPNGYFLDSYGFRLEKGALPVPGKYLFQLDFASDVSVEYKSASLVTTRKKNNVTEESASVNVMNYSQFNSGDFFTEFVGQFGSINSLRLSCRLDETLPASSLIAGYVEIAFTETDAPVDVDVVSTVDSEADYQADVSSSLSDLSSSVGEMSDEISGVTQAIQNLQGAMEPHYNNVLTQLHHITEQLHAFWDQQFNLHHVPLMAKLADIIDAIGNMDLEVEVNLNSLKTSIDTMSQNVQNKLQSTTDQITGGYDNSGIVSDQTELDSALNEYQQAEDELFDDAKDHLNNFEFDTPLDQFIKPIQDISYFMTGIFDGLGGLNIPIQFSLTLTIALILIGYYRIKR